MSNLTPTPKFTPLPSNPSISPAGGAFGVSGAGSGARSGGGAAFDPISEVDEESYDEELCSIFDTMSMDIHRPPDSERSSLEHRRLSSSGSGTSTAFSTEFQEELKTEFQEELKTDERQSKKLRSKPTTTENERPTTKPFRKKE